MTDKAYELVCNKLDALTREEIYRLPPEPVLAEDVGVSRITIRRVLARMEHERLIDRQKGRGTFIRPRKQTHHIVVLYRSCGELFHPWISGIMRGVAEDSSDYGINLTFRPLPLWGDEGLGQRLINDVRNHDVDGYLVVLRLHLKDCLQVFHSHVPLVLVEEDYRRTDIPAILVDHALAAEMVMDHFKNNQRRRITIISGPRGIETRRKADVIAEAINNNAGDAKITQIATDRSVAEGCKVMRKLMRRKQPPDAIFTTDDDLAVGVFLALNEGNGIESSRPDIVSYVSPYTKLSSLLPWKVIEMPSPELLGKKAVNMLHTLMLGEKISPVVNCLKPKIL